MAKQLKSIETQKEENRNNFQKTYQERIKKFSQDTKKIESNSTIIIKNTPQQESREHTYQFKEAQNKSLFTGEEERKIQLLEEKIQESLVAQKELEAKQKFEQKGVVMCLTHIPLKNSIRLGLTCFSQKLIYVAVCF